MPKRTLVLLPGLLNDHRLFQHQISNLADIVALNVADLTQANSMSELAAHVLDEAPREPFALAGLSMGGYLALEIMRQAPKRVSALALLEPIRQSQSRTEKRYLSFQNQIFQPSLKN